MAWITSHQELARHPKTRKLSRLLGISLPDTIGRLHLLWWWALDYAEDGNLSRYEDADIADALLWEGDPTVLVEALVTAGFVDEDRSIHDWWDYAGRLVEQRRTNAQRMKAKRTNNVHNTCDARTTHEPGTCDARTTHEPGTCDARTGATEENSTEQDSTEQDNSAPSGAIADKPLTKNALPEKANYSPPSPYSEAELVYMRNWGRKRLNDVQRQKIAEVVKEAGLPVWQKANEWAALNNIPQLGSIITRARNIKKGGNTGGRYTGNPKQSAGARPGGDGRFTGSTTEDALQWARDHGGNLPFGWRYIERDGASVPVKD